LRAKRGSLHIFYTWLVVVLAVWQLYLLFPALDLDRGRDLAAVILLWILAEWFSVPIPYGRLSGGFALILSAFMIYGAAAAVWISGLATLFGQGIINRGSPLRTTLFNSGQNVLAAVAAAFFFRQSGGMPGQLSVTNILPLAAFVLAYIVVNHLLVAIYLWPRKRRQPHPAWLETFKWDGLTYLFTVPAAVLIAVVYGYVGLAGMVLLFFSVLALQLIFRYYIRLQLANKELQAFYEMARAVKNGAAEPAALLDMVLKSAGKAFSFHTGIVYYRPEGRGAYLPAAVTGPYAEQLQSTAVYPGEGVAGLSLAGKEPLMVLDSRVDSRTIDEAGLYRVMRSQVIVPLVSGKEALGLVVLGEKRPMAFDEHHLHITTVLAGQAAAAVGNSILRKRLEDAAFRDNLTGLLDAAGFFWLARDTCANAAQKGIPAGMILINIDHFKVFNLRYGRVAGERALADMAALVEVNAREGDLIARYGGNEFVLLLPGITGAALSDRAGYIRGVIREYNFLKKEGRGGRLTVSIGVAEFPQDAGDLTGLLKAAQRALEKAKTGGGDRVESAAVELV